jgi:hypothetical protein
MFGKDVWDRHQWRVLAAAPWVPTFRLTLGAGRIADSLRPTPRMFRFLRDWAGDFSWIVTASGRQSISRTDKLSNRN